MDKTLLTRLTTLAEPIRLDILMIISESGTCCAGDILSHFDITQPTLSHHMRVLIENDLVNAVKDGRFMRYSVNTGAVTELKQILDDLCADKSASSDVYEPVSPKADENRLKSGKKKDKDKRKKKDKKKKK